MFKKLFQKKGDRKNAPHFRPHEFLFPEQTRQDNTDVAKSYARTFSSPEGEKVLAHLQTTTLYRASPLESSEEQLRHLEGQRYLVGQILRRISHGKNA